MLETIIKQDVIFYVIGLFFALGVIAKAISYITARKLVKAAGEIHKSNQKLMKLIKAKFEHASMVSDKVKNVEAFVNKYFYEYKVFGASIVSWQSFSFKMIGLIITFGLIGMVVGFNAYGLGERTFRYGILAAIYTVVLVSIHILSDEKSKMDAAKNYIVEYLENVCVRRYEKANKVLQSAEDSEQVEESEIRVAEDVLQTVQEESQQKEPEAEPETTSEQILLQEETVKTRDDQEMRIRAILEEFLA